MEPMDYRRVLVERLVQIEESHDVNALTYKGLKIWPMLRGSLGSAYENKQIGHGRHAPHHMQRTLWPRYELNRSIQTALNPDEKLEAHQIAGENAPSLGELCGQAQCLFFSRRVRNFKTNRGKFTNHQDDFLFDLLSKEFSCLKIEAAERYTPHTIPRVVSPVCFQTPWNNDFNIFKEKFSPHCPPWPERAETEKFLKSAQAICDLDGDTVNIDLVERMLHYIEANMQVYLEILGTLQPTAIFFGLYLANETMGMIAAAKRLGIPTIEIQHGLIGRYQWFQTHYTKIPPEGYELLPDFFWVWDKTTKEDTEREMPVSPGPHRAIIGGNPALESWTATRGRSLGTYQALFFEGLDQRDNVILVALQYYSLAPDNIIQAMKLAPKEWLWLIRLHPMSRSLQDVVTEVYQSHGLDNIEVFYATDAPLYDLLQHVDHVVTPFSTIAIEAAHFNIPVTLTERVSVEVFAGFDNDNQGFADDPEAICDRIRETRDAAPKNRSDRPEHPLIPRAIAATAEIFADWDFRNNETRARIDKMSKYPVFTEPPMEYDILKAEVMMDRVVKLAQSTLRENTLKWLTPLSKSARRLEKRLFNR
jgi:hypothetical protein